MGQTELRRHRIDFVWLSLVSETKAKSDDGEDAAVGVANGGARTPGESTAGLLDEETRRTV